MTVSHMWMGKDILNAEINWESFKKELEGEELKIKQGKDGQPDKVKRPEYDIKDKLFCELVKTLALSTTTFFFFDPADDEVKNWYRKDEKKNNRSPITWPKEKDKWSKDQEAVFAKAKTDMQAEEKDRRFVKRLTKGDASETGLIRFITPLLMAEYAGIWSVPKDSNFENALDQYRAAFPTLLDPKQNEYAIPFNSSIKFNLMIRDANKAVTQPRSAADNVTVYLKGAPEKVLKRCSRVLMRGNDGELFDVDFDKQMQFNVNAANDRFGLMGERVLAFAKTELHPE